MGDSNSSASIGGLNATDDASIQASVAVLPQQHAGLNAPDDVLLELFEWDASGMEPELQAFFGAAS